MHRVLRTVVTTLVVLSLAGVSSPQPATSTRTIPFPEERSLGTVWLETHPDTRRYRFSSGETLDGSLAEWTCLGAAQGNVTVPTDGRVRLEVTPAGLKDLSPLRELNSSDLFEVYVWCARGAQVDGDVDIMPHVAGLTGLKVLRIWDVGVTDAGLHYIESMKGLEELHLPYQRLGNVGALSIVELPSLRALWLTGEMTDAGLRRLAGLASLKELRIDVSRVRGAGIAHLARRSNLELLHLGGEGFGNEKLRHLKGMASLKWLEITGNLGVTNRGLAVLADLPQLEALTLYGVGITDAGLHHLQSLRSLKTLVLRGASVSEAGLALLTPLSSLESLTLPSRGMTDAALAHVAELRSLRKLDAGGITPASLAKPGPFTDAGLRHLSKLGRLEWLRMNTGSGITDAGMSHLAGMNLKYLHLMLNGIGDRGLSTLAGITTLEELHLRFPNARRVTVSGVNQLNAVTLLRVLHVSPIVQDGAGLDLSQLTGLQDLALRVVYGPGKHAVDALRDEDTASLAGLTGLRELNLGRGTTFSDAGMAHLAGLENLHRLNIGGGRVTDKGLRYIADKRSLTKLTLEGDFTDEGLRQLGGLEGVTHLRIDSKNDLSMVAIARLQDALPNLRSFNDASCQR